MSKQKIRTEVAVIDGSKMSEARIAAGLSMEDVAGFLGVNKSSVSRWEQGLLNPTPERVEKMIKLFRCEDFTVQEARLDWAKVRQIRKLCAEGDKSYREIGKMYGIGKEMVSDIKNNRLWKEERVRG